VVRACVPRMQIVWKFSSDFLSGVKGFSLRSIYLSFWLKKGLTNPAVCVWNDSTGFKREFDWHVLSSIRRHPCCATHHPMSHPPSLQASSRVSPQSAENTCGAALVIKRCHQGQNICQLM